MREGGALRQQWSFPRRLSPRGRKRRVFFGSAFAPPEIRAWDQLFRTRVLQKCSKSVRSEVTLLPLCAKSVCSAGGGAATMRQFCSQHCRPALAPGGGQLRNGN